MTYESPIQFGSSHLARELTIRWITRQCIKSSRTLRCAIPGSVSDVSVASAGAGRGASASCWRVLQRNHGRIHFPAAFLSVSRFCVSLHDQSLRDGVTRGVLCCVRVRTCQPTPPRQPTHTCTFRARLLTCYFYSCLSLDV